MTTAQQLLPCDTMLVWYMPLLCVCLSQVTTETAKDRITQTMPHDSPWTLVFWCWTSRHNSNGVTPNGGM